MYNIRVRVLTEQLTNFISILSLRGWYKPVYQTNRNNVQCYSRLIFVLLTFTLKSSDKWCLNSHNVEVELQVLWREHSQTVVNNWASCTSRISWLWGVFHDRNTSIIFLIRQQFCSRTYQRVGALVTFWDCNRKMMAAWGNALDFYLFQCSRPGRILPNFSLFDVHRLK